MSAELSARHVAATGVPGDDYVRKGRRREFRRDALTVLSWAFIAASLALFLADGGASQFNTLGGGVVALGTISGLVATAFVAFMTILIARVPIIDATIGQDRATILHATLGKGVVYGLVAHALFLLVGYSISGKVDLVSAFASLWEGGGLDFIWAWVGLALFIGIGVTSLLAFRRRNPYELWYAIHLTTYLAVLASLPHQFSMSGLLAPGTKSRALWLAMWVLAAFCVLAFRVFLPLYTSLEHRLRVKRVVPAGQDAVSIELVGKGVERLGATGGNWFNWRFWTPELALQPHPFSLSAEPTEDGLRLTVRNLGNGSARIQRLRPGTAVSIEGPYGLFTDAARTRDRVVLAGAGIGIAPVRALLEATSVEPGKAAVILRATTPKQLYLADEITAICTARGVPVITLVGSRAGQRWVPTSHAGHRLTDFVPWVAEADVYVCGPDAWMDAFAEDARICGVAPAQLHRESFDW